MARQIDFAILSKSKRGDITLKLRPIGYCLNINIDDLRARGSRYARDLAAAGIDFVTGRANGYDKIITAFGARICHQCCILGRSEIIDPSGFVSSRRIAHVRHIRQDNRDFAIEWRQCFPTRGKRYAIGACAADCQGDFT